MPHSVDRRGFLTASVRALIGASTIGHVGCGRAATNAQAGLSALIADLEQRIPRALAEHKVPGLSIALVRASQLVWQRGFGMADAASKLPVDAGTIFEAQSMSKPVFAYVALKLCEAGVLGLDTPLTTYTPERPVHGDPRMDLITARHVLSHTTGFQNWRGAKDPLSIQFTPGARWLYSGEGYSFLQSVVTRLTGRTDPSACATFEAGFRVCATDIDAYMKAHLLVPFGMSASGYVWDDTWTGRVARPHDVKGLPLEKGRPDAAGAARYASSGGLHATPADYARFLIEVIAPKPADAFRLTADSLQTMTRPVIAVPDDPRRSSWALGWQVFPTPDGDVIAHGGDGSGFHSFAVASVSQRSAYVIMTNGENGWKLAQELISSEEMHRLLTA
jgi:CubicO group peptidase (beta-lactamase class C family)